MAEETTLIVELLMGGRALRGQTIAQASQAAGVNASYWSHVEKSGPKVPSADWIRKVSHTAGAPWVASEKNERMFLGASFASWGNSDHFGHDTTPPISVIAALADRLAGALRPITTNPLPVEMLDATQTGERGLAELFARLATSYNLPGLAPLATGHGVDDNAVVVLMIWGLVAGGANAAAEADQWLSISESGSYIAEMVARAFPAWIAASATNDTKGDESDASWAYVQAHWDSLTPSQRSIIRQLIASWLVD